MTLSQAIFNDNLRVFNMKRKAILIGSPQIEGKNGYLKGVTPDIIKMKKHLLSCKGGAWYDSEIVVLKNPTKEEILSEAYEQCDYLFVQYSGHGFERQNGRTYLLLDYDDISKSIALDEIIQVSRAPKIFCFLDSCRGFVTLKEERLLENSVQFSLESYDDRKIYYREKFDSFLSECENGCTKIFSCSQSESASEDDNGKGGYFTSVYLEVAKAASPKVQNHYTIKNIFDKAILQLPLSYPDATQTPEIAPERRRNYFPFCV